MATPTNLNSTRDVVRKFAERVRTQKPDVWRMYLFGSHARGTARLDSDIDVAVFLNRDEIDSFREDVDLMELRWDIDLRIEPRTFTKLDFEDPDPFISEILETGERVI